MSFTLQNMTMTGGMSWAVNPSYGSIQLNGSSQYLTVPGNAAFNFGTGNFTFECWVYINAYSATTGFFTVGNEATGRYYFALQNSGQPWSNQYGGSNFTWGTSTSVPLNAWTHIAWVNVGGTVSCYVNGTSLGTQTFSGQVGNAGGVWVGANPSGGYLWSGYISNLRLSNLAVYTSNFTPSLVPLTSTQLTNVNGNPSVAITGTTSTALLLNTSNNSSYLTDSSSYNSTITNVNSATSQAFNPFSPGIGSVVFNGTTQYLSVPANTAAFSYGANDFTWECWVYPTAFGAAAGSTIDFWSNASGAYIIGQCQLQINTNGTVQFYYATTVSTLTSIITTTTLSLNNWYHIAVVRSGSGTGNLKIYINGVVSATSAGAVTQALGSTGAGAIGRQTNVTGTSYFYTGYISNVRVVNGVAVYTSNFVLPTGPLTRIQNTNQNGNPAAAITSTQTSLLLNTPNNLSAFKDTSTNAFTITNNGTATSQAANPFGL